MRSRDLSNEMIQVAYSHDINRSHRQQRVHDMHVADAANVARLHENDGRRIAALVPETGDLSLLAELLNRSTVRLVPDNLH